MGEATMKPILLAVLVGVIGLRGPVFCQSARTDANPQTHFILPRMTPESGFRDAVSDGVAGRTNSVERAFSHLQRRVEAETSDHRREGLVLGAVVLGAGAAVVGWQLCRDPEGGRSSATKCFLLDVPFSAMGAVVGGGIGALLGGLIPKAHPD